MDRQKYYTLNTLHQSGRIWWIKSLPTLKKWVLKDINHHNLLKTIIDSDGKAPRYYFLKDNVENYVKAFGQNTIVGEAKNPIAE